MTTVVPVQYIILNTSVDMSPGKAAAQAAHAAVQGFHKGTTFSRGVDRYEELYSKWLSGGEAKVVLGAPDLFVAERYIQNTGLLSHVPHHMVIDEGRTEFNGGHTPTALGFGVVDKDDPKVRQAFGNFKLYKGPELWGYPVKTDPSNPRDEIKVEQAPACLFCGSPHNVKRGICKRCRGWTGATLTEVEAYASKILAKSKSASKENIVCTECGADRISQCLCAGDPM